MESLLADALQRNIPLQPQIPTSSTTSSSSIPNRERSTESYSKNNYRKKQKRKDGETIGERRKRRRSQRQSRNNRSSNDVVKELLSNVASVALDTADIAKSKAKGAVKRGIEILDNEFYIDDYIADLLEEDILFQENGVIVDDDGAIEAEWSYTRKEEASRYGAKKRRKKKKKKVRSSQKYGNATKEVNRNNPRRLPPSTSMKKIPYPENTYQNENKMRSKKVNNKQQFSNRRRSNISQSTSIDDESKIFERKGNSTDSRNDDSRQTQTTKSSSSSSKRRRNLKNEPDFSIDQNAIHGDPDFTFDTLGDWIIDAADGAIGKTGEFVDYIIDEDPFLSERDKRRGRSQKYWKDKFSESVDEVFGVHNHGKDYNEWEEKMKNEEYGDDPLSMARGLKRKPKTRNKFKRASFWEKDGSLISMLLGRSPSTMDRFSRVRKNNVVFQLAFTL